MSIWLLFHRFNQIYNVDISSCHCSCIKIDSLSKHWRLDRDRHGCWREIVVESATEHDQEHDQDMLLGTNQPSTLATAAIPSCHKFNYSLRAKRLSC